MILIFDSLALALAYLDRHMYTRYIFPIKAGAKFPPLVKDNLEGNASNDPKQIAAWSRKWPGCNWGVAHKKSRLLVVDVDCNEAKGKVGQATFDNLSLAYDWPETEKTVTPSGGFHLVYTGDHIMALGKNGIGQDIDSPNYTLIAGCVFKDGTRYVGDDVDAVPCPSWIYDVIKNAKSKARLSNAGDVVIELDQPRNIETAIDFLQEDAEPAIEGKGGDFNTLKTAMYLKDLGISPSLAVDLLVEYYNPRCEPPWDRDDLERKVENAQTYSSLSKGGGKTAEADFADDPPEKPKPQGSKKVIAQQRRERANARAAEAARPPEERRGPVTRNTVVNDWVWIGGTERFIAKTDTEMQWKKSAFDNYYRELVKKGEAKSFADLLFSAKKGTIMKYKSVAFKPGEPQTIGENFNLYTPPDVAPVEGDTTWWTDHLTYLFPEPEYRDHVQNWMAWLLQNVAKKPKHALIIQGPEQGTGKSFIAQVLGRLVHQKNVAIVSQSNLRSDFNGWAERAKLIVIEELRAVERAEVAQNLHDIITEDIISINRKGVDTHKMETCFGIMAMTNNDAALMLDNSDRRYLIVRTEVKPRGADYYAVLYGKLNDPAAMSALMFALMSRELGEYSGEQAAPATAAKQGMLEAGASDLEVFMVEHSTDYPFNGAMVCMDDIINVLPKRLESRSARLFSSIKTILKTRFGAVELGQAVIADGSRPRMYGINGKAGILANLTPKELGTLYEANRAKAGKGQDIEDGAASEFGVDETSDQA